MPYNIDTNVETLTKLYRQIQQGLYKQLVTASIDAANNEWTIKRANIMLEQIRQELETLHADVTQLEGDMLPQAFQEGGYQAQKTLQDIGESVKTLPSDWVKLNTKTIESLARDIAGQRGLFLGVIPGKNGIPYPGSILRGVDDFLRTLQTNTLIDGAALGRSSRQSGAALRTSAIEALKQNQALQNLSQEIDRACGVAYLNSEGKEVAYHSLEFYGQMSARTGQARMLEEGNIAAQQNLGVELFEVSKHGTLCYICRPFEGKVFRYEFAKSAKAMKYPLCPREIPFHPNCMHSRQPWVVEIFGDAIPTEEDMKLLNSSNTDLYSHMTDQPRGRELMRAAKQGYATENGYNKDLKALKAKMNGKSDEDILKAQRELKGPRWKMKGIENRRLEATQMMLENPGMSYSQAIGKVTQKYMRDMKSVTAAKVAKVPKPPVVPPVIPAKGAYDSGNIPFDKAVNEIHTKIKDLPIEHLYLLDDKGTVLFNNIGNEHEVSFREAFGMLAENKNKLTLIHNHPSGSSFSDADIKAMVRHEIKEVQAITSTHIHVMTTKIDGVYPKNEMYLLEYMDDSVNNFRRTPGNENKTISNHEVWKGVSELPYGKLDYKRIPL